MDDIDYANLPVCTECGHVGANVTLKGLRCTKCGARSEKPRPRIKDE
jgi:hypothetical protein